MRSSQPPAQEVRSIGYSPLRIFAAHLLLKVRSPESSASEETPAAFQWNWRFATDDTIDVVFGVKLEATKARSEDVEVLISGTFKLSASSTIKLDHFVRTNAVATLYPFVREAVSSLTAHGMFGAYLVPLLNTVNLAKRLEMRGTEGHDRLLHDRNLRERILPLLSPDMIATLESNDSIVASGETAPVALPSTSERSPAGGKKVAKRPTK